jgi:CRP/FNR family transcriptional regulator
MERESRKELIARFELFRGFTERESRMVDKRMEKRRFLKGDAIFRRADPGDSLYLLMEGLVKIVAYSGRGAGTIIYILRPPDIFGELLLSEEKRPFHALAATDARAGVLSREHVVELLSRIPRFRLNFIRNLSHRLVRVAKGVAEFRHARSSHRLAKVLLRMSGEDGEETPGGFPLRLSLTHADLAEMIGATRETVTIQMNRFRRLGLVEIRNRRLVVDRRRLAEYLRAGEMRQGGYRSTIREGSRHGLSTRAGSRWTK